MSWRFSRRSRGAEMGMFVLREERLNPPEYRDGLAAVAEPGAGAIVTFGGHVRDHTSGQRVERLLYEAYPELARKEGTRILAEVQRKHELEGLAAVQRTGVLWPGALAVWVGAAAAHRETAFRACRQVIDRFKTELPVWKREVLADGETRWVRPQGLQREGRG